MRMNLIYYPNLNTFVSQRMLLIITAGKEAEVGTVPGKSLQMVILSRARDTPGRSSEDELLIRGPGCPPYLCA
jgi:hypothetical protein